MSLLRDAPLRQKLVALLLLSSGGALVVACGALLAYELTAYRSETLHELESVAGVIAANSSAALSFDHPESAETTLSALSSEERIIAACIYRPDGPLFASYRRVGGEGGCEVAGDGARPAERPGGALSLSLPIVLGGEQIGTIVVRSEPVDLLQRLVRYGSVVGLAMLLAGIASLPLASRLQRFISDPILRLVDTARRVSGDQDFSVRALSESEDEVGVLVGAFNEMLEQIQTRDLALARHREHLEEEVDQRIGELKAVNAALEREIAQRQHAEKRIRHLAYYDGLTGLPNRQLFQEQLQRALETGRRRRTMVGLLFIDLDRFKQVNDTLGHNAGDDLLRQVAERVGRSVRFTDCVARTDIDRLPGEVSRLGGDEFTVLLTEISRPEDAAMVAQRILDEFSEPFPIAGHELFSTASIGVAVFPHDGDDAETLLRNADTSMYHAKSRHRNSFEFYSAEMSRNASRRLHLANRLRQALERDGLTLYYQPLRAATDGRVTAAEALLRWHDAEAGPVAPDEFIPIAEDTGLIVTIGEWVLRTACEQARSWQRAGYRDLRLAVNVSSHELRQPSWSQTVVRTLEATGLSPGSVELEVTETAILRDDDLTSATLSELGALGVGFALDDFGTGYSSLSYLRRYPIGRVKIDRSFVRDVITDPEDAALTSAILAMAKSLRLAVVAEGVETEEQARFMRERGCDELQGYLFSRPLPADEFTRFLEREKEA